MGVDMSLDHLVDWAGERVDEFVVPANARFCWFSGSNIVKDRAPAPSEYNVEHVNTLIAQASPFLRFPEEFLCWVGISQMDLNAFIRTTDPRKVWIVERARAKNEGPIMTVAKHPTATLLPTSVVRPSGELSASVEREFVRDASVGGGGDEGVASVDGQDNVKPIVPITDNVETEIPGPKRTKKKRVTRGSERTPVVSHPPKRLRADYGTTSGSATGGKSPSVLNRMLQDSRLMVEHGVPSLLTLPFITSSMTASPLEEGGDHTDSVTGPSLRTVVALPCIDVGKDKSVPHSSVFGSSSSSEKTDHTLSLFTGRSGSGFATREYSCGGEKKKWRSLAEEKDSLLGVKDKEIKELRSQLLKAQEDLEAIEGSLRGKVASAKEHNGLLEQECGSLKLKVHELETSSTDLREKLEMYEESMKRLEEFQDNLMRPLETRLAEIDADFTRCCMRFQESFHPHLLNVVAGRRWLLIYRMKLLMAKCLNSTEYMEALGNAFGRAIEKGMQEGLAAGIEHGQAGRCLTDLEAYIPSAEDDFNSAVCDLRGLNFSLLQELSNKKDASTWDIMDLLRLDDAVAEALGMMIFKIDGIQN
ncbi:hypothetical protein Tco_0784544 [Tanacetum coccineum]